MRKLEVIIANKNTNEEIYERDIYNDGLYPYSKYHPDEEFCAALNIPFDTEDLPITEVEIVPRSLFIEWWKFLRRKLNIKQQFLDIEKVFYIKDEDEMYKQIYFLQTEQLIKYCIIFSEVQEYTRDIDFNKIEEGYKIYLRVY